MRRPRWACSVAAIAALLAVSREASAQNLREVPLGGRTALMGGAGVASGLDSAMPYLNPAGVAATPADVISVSGTIYSGLAASVPNYYVPTTRSPEYRDVGISEQKYNLSQLQALPSAISYFRRFGDDQDPYRHVIALSLLAPTFDQEDIQGTFRAAGPVHRLTADSLGQARYRQLLAGPTWGIRFGDRLHVGASLFGSFSDMVSDGQELSAVSNTAGGSDVLATTNDRTLVDAYSIGLSFVGGAQLRVVDHLWIGGAYETGTLPLYGSGTYRRVVDDGFTMGPMNAPGSRRTQIDGGFRGVNLGRPTRISAGLSYDVPHSWALAADVHFTPGGQTFRTWTIDATSSTSQTGSVYAETPQTMDYRRRTRPTTNVSIGGEVFVAESLAIRGGFSTDHDVAEEQTVGEDRKNGRIDWYMVTLGLGHTHGVLGAAYGLAYRYGDGLTYVRDRFGPDPNAIVAVPYSAHGVMLVLSGSVTIAEKECSDEAK